MKSITSILFFALASVAFSCSDDQIKPETSCSTPAVVRIFSDTLDGCGIMFQLEDGSYLQPLMTIRCGTPEMKDEPMAPIFNFELAEGMHVRIDYKVLPTFATVCMNGTLVDVTCMSKDDQTVTED